MRSENLIYLNYIKTLESLTHSINHEAMEIELELGGDLCYAIANLFFLRWSDHNVWLSDYTEWLMNGEFSSKNRHQSYILSPTMRHIVRISLWHCICHGDTCPLNSAFLHHATFTAINWYYAYSVCSFHSTT